MIIEMLTTKPLSLLPALLIAGAALAGIGVVLIVGCGLFLLRAQAGAAAGWSGVRHRKWRLAFLTLETSFFILIFF